MEVKKGIIAFFGTACGYLFGGLDSLIIAFTVFVVIDYITGVLAAIFQKRLSSEQGIKGIIKKIGLFALVIVAQICDTTFGLDGVVRTTVVLFVVANEAISILENLGNIGVKIPKKLTTVLAQLSKEGGNETEENGIAGTDKEGR